MASLKQRTQRLLVLVERQAPAVPDRIRRLSDEELDARIAELERQARAEMGDAAFEAWLEAACPLD